VTLLSAVIITRDEEHQLAGALESVGFADEILVVDSGSTDATCRIAEEMGARVIVRTPWPGFVEQRNHAVAAAAHDWVLALDADERVTPALRTEIRALLSAGPGASGYRMRRVAHYLGRWIRDTDWYPDWQLRLFDRRVGSWSGGRVHESVSVRGSIGRLAGELEHYPYRDIGHHLRTIDRYTALWARDAFESGRPARILESALAPTWSFLRSYVLKAGFRLGWVGFVVAAMGSYYTFLKLARLAELRRVRPGS